MNNYEDNFESLNNNGNSDLSSESSAPDTDSKASYDEISYEPVSNYEFKENSTDDIQSSKADENYTDSYYMNASGDKVDVNSQPFYRSNFKSKKKKRYVSVPAAVVAMILTATVSISGSALIYKSNLLGNNPANVAHNNSAKISVEDNISKSENLVEGQKATLNTVNGISLSTPEVVDMVGPAVVGIVNKTTFGNAYGYYGFFGGDVNEEIEQ
ncbi:MAG: hypothetical protein J6B23_08660, partial [Clostridia bacterium]|nr:hypothetical protein [Clostridia bacterium]